MTDRANQSQVSISNMNQKGFTLIEVILYLGITSILIFSLASFVGFLTQTKARSHVTAQVDEQGIAVMQQITQLLRNAESVFVPTIGGSGSVLTFTQDGASSTTTILVDNGILEMHDGTNPAIALTNESITVSNFTVENVSRPDATTVIKIAMTVAYNTANAANEYQYEKTFYGTATLRNYE